MLNLKNLVHRLVASLLLLTALPLQAGLVVPLSIEQLAQKSEVVLHGTVLGKVCQRDPAGRIYTRVELQVIEVWQGRAGTSRFTLVHAGGALGETHAPAPENETYEIGEEIVVFAVVNQRGEAVALGLGQGKFTVWKEAGDRLVRSRFHGRPAAPGRQTSAGDIAARPQLTLADLKRRATTSAP